MSKEKVLSQVDNIQSNVALVLKECKSLTIENQKLKKIIELGERKVSQGQKTGIILRENQKGLQELKSNVQRKDEEILDLRQKIASLEETLDREKQSKKEDVSKEKEKLAKAKSKEMKSALEDSEAAQKDFEKKLKVKDLLLQKREDQFNKEKRTLLNKLVLAEEDLIRYRKKVSDSETNIERQAKDLLQLKMISQARIESLEGEIRLLKGKRVAEVPPFSAKPPSPKRRKRVSFDELIQVRGLDSPDKVSTTTIRPEKSPRKYFGFPSIRSYFEPVTQNKPILKKTGDQVNNAGDQSPFLWSVNDNSNVHGSSISR